MKSTRYTDEYKDDAVAYYQKSNKTVRECAKDLKINYDSLARWIRLANVEKRKSEPQVMSSMGIKELQEENKRLRKELANEKEVNAILKKVTAIFAKD